MLPFQEDCPHLARDLPISAPSPLGPHVAANDGLLWEVHRLPPLPLDETKTARLLMRQRFLLGTD